MTEQTLVQLGYNAFLEMSLGWKYNLYTKFLAQKSSRNLIIRDSYISVREIKSAEHPRTIQSQIQMSFRIRSPTARSAAKLTPNHLIVSETLRRLLFEN